MNSKINKKWLKHQEELAKEFKLSVEDIHNLYDCFNIIKIMNIKVQMEMKVDFRKTLKVNGLLEWFREFMQRLDDICLSELKDEEEIRYFKTRKEAMKERDKLKESYAVYYRIKEGYYLVKNKDV